MSDEYTEDELRMYSAWSDYRKEYSAYEDSAHGEFVAGWYAARANWNVDAEYDAHSDDWRSGYEAFHGNLDLGGPLR